MWTMTDGIAVARLLEPIAIANGYHVALGGGVLQNAVSSHDLDIFFYLHTTLAEQPKAKISPEEFVTRLSEVGFVSDQDKLCKTASVSDGWYKRIIKTEYMGRVVDLIFLMPVYLYA